MAKKLGLPLDYKKLPEYFDNVNNNDDKKNSVIEKLLKKHKTKTVLDMTCGTGSQVFFLIKHGYEVTGADFSPDLLITARDKAKKQKLDVKFIDDDMRKLKAGQFDAVITIHNAVGHLTKNGFEKAMRNIRNNLNNGGIYVFDIFNLNAMTDAVVANLACYKQNKVGDTNIYEMQCSAVDRESGILTSYDSYMIQKNADKPERFHHQFSLQIYTAKELREMLARNGFETIEQYGMDGEAFIEAKTESILTVARKI